jgi:hypothetical protein
MEKYATIIFILLILIPFISSNLGYDDEVGFSCGGSEELIVGCLSDEEVSMFIGSVPSVPVIQQGGDGYTTIGNVTKVTKGPTLSQCCNVGIPIILLVILFWLIVLKKRKKKKEKDKLKKESVKQEDF